MLLPETLPATPRRRTRPAAVLALVVAVATLGVVLGRSSSSPAAPSPVAPRPSARLESMSSSTEPVAAQPSTPPKEEDGRQAAVGRAEGEVPDDVTVFDTGYPAVERLDPSLLGALRTAARDAAHDRVELYVTSGWRARAYQTQLFREAVTQYGSTAEAARWVAVPGTSAHESGEAVDIGHTDAVAWLARYGARYGLCQVYGNESWHYEYRRTAVTDGCPRPYADPTEDPRLHR